MRKLIPIIISASVLLIPQFSAIADERKTQVFNSTTGQSQEQLLSRAAHYRAWKLRGDEAFETGNYRRAIALYDQAIAIDGDQHSAWERRGDALVKKEDYQAAIEAYNEAINVAAEPETQIQEKIESTREQLARKLSD